MSGRGYLSLMTSCMNSLLSLVKSSSCCLYGKKKLVSFYNDQHLMLLYVSLQTTRVCLINHGGNLFLGYGFNSFFPRFGRVKVSNLQIESSIAAKFAQNIIINNA